MPSARLLTSEEQELVYWLVLHGHPAARACVDQVAKLQVKAERHNDDRLTLEFAHTKGSGPKVMLAEFVEKNGEQVTTVVLFGQNGQLVSLEAWAAEGSRIPHLPSPASLHAIT